MHDPFSQSQSGERLIILSSDATWKIRVEGVVRNPGLYFVEEGTTFLDMLLVAGIREWPQDKPHSAIKRVQCEMMYEGELRRFAVDASYYLENPENDFILSNGAIISVPKLIGL